VAVKNYWDLREVLVRVAKQHDKYKGKNDTVNAIMMAVNDLLHTGNKQTATEAIYKALTSAQSASQSEIDTKARST
jgi:ribosomal protein S7